MAALKPRLSAEEQLKLWDEKTRAFGGYGTRTPTMEEVERFNEQMRLNRMKELAPIATEEQRKYFEETYQAWQWEEKVERQLRIAEAKVEAIQNGTLGQFYKQEMLENLTLVTIDGKEYYSTTIDGRKILIGKRNIDADFPGSKDSLRNVHSAISNMRDEAIIGLAKFGDSNSDLIITSMWRHDNNGPHEWGRAFDLSMPENTPVYAAEGGRVITAGYSKSAGKMITIQGDDGLTYRYMHNNKLLYRNNQVVNAGDNITLSGNTGLSSGPHLHFDVQ